MGCDIHMEIEELRDGQWVLIAEDVFDTRCYPLFALLAGVRNEEEWGIAPIDMPRGVPGDASALYRKRVAVQEEYNYHSWSWLTVEDLRKVDPDATYTRNGFTNTLGSLLGMLPIEPLYDYTKPRRLVFCFDN